MRVWTVPGVDPIPIPTVPWEVEYDNDLERNKRTSRSYPHPFFDDDAVTWERLTGIHGLEADPTNHGGGLQVVGLNGYVATHLDYDHSPVVPARRRALSVVAFVNEEWLPEWGGALIFCDPSGRVRQRVYPVPNLTVAFECTDMSYHGVEKVTGPVERVTLAKSLLVPVGRTRALFIPHREAK